MSNGSKSHYQSPTNALNLAYKRVKPLREDFEQFKADLSKLIDQISSKEQEEHNKNLVRDFLQKTWYDPNHSINTKGDTDLVIHNQSSSKSPVGVLIEAKRPNGPQMVSLNDLNNKALQELLYYYLQERLEDENTDIKHLIVTDAEQWFIFDANEFEKNFVQYKWLKKEFKKFQEERGSGLGTDFFYREIASQAIEEKKDRLHFTYFKLSDYEKPLSGDDEESERKLLELYKVLSPQHLLKLPFTNDSNTLDRSFYSELLYIIGLQEVKDKGKVLIQRKPKNERDPGSLIESTISQLDSLDKIPRLDKPSQYGSTHEERLFNVALELVIIWINRVLFLKLLEGQLLTYHKNSEKEFRFLNYETIKSYDDLNTLFFSVLANKPEDRREEIKEKYSKVPYLNSSLFEVSDLEHETLMISDLHDNHSIAVYNSTVLLDQKGKNKLKGELNILQYLFRFLNAYDFASEGSEDVQEENKTLINASVLGLIFEKINGYKEGSFFTPGFVTMFMARETVRKAVIQKFEDFFETGEDGLGSISEVRKQIRNGETSLRKANEVVNGLKVCDPAVGSGHFLVSVLNEIIAVKNELEILMDEEERTLAGDGYEVQVVNDELVVTGDDRKLFEYNPESRISQRIQETLFKEKQNIIENCLFGVDINTNSVKICRLRLWIELLKNAYYRVPEGPNIGGFDPENAELETLPNIDINIKAGNSLISRFPLDANLKKVLKNTDWTIEKYREAVQKYRHATDRTEKREMEDLIEGIKSDFRTEIRNNDPLLIEKNRKEGQLYNLRQPVMVEETEAQKERRQKKEKKLEKEVNKLKNKIEEIKNSKIYENAFEWRFEFPEVLDEDGGFVGFDIVIGNPPYIRQERLKWMKDYLKENYVVYRGTADLYSYFIELGVKILKKKGVFEFIVANKWMRADYGDALRKWLKNEVSIETIYDFGDLEVFDEASTYPCLLQLRNEQPSEEFAAAIIEHLDFDDLEEHISEREFSMYQEMLNKSGWALIERNVQLLVDNIYERCVSFGDYIGQENIKYGVKTGLNNAFIIREGEKDDLIKEDSNSSFFIKPWIVGKSVKKYRKPESDEYIIMIPSGWTRENSNGEDKWEWFENNYPAIANHLLKFEEKAKRRYDQGEYWWELRPCDYYSSFEKPKIIWAEIAKEGQFSIDYEGFYLDTTGYITPVESKPLLGVLNSKVWTYLFSKISSEIRGGYFRWKRQYMETMPLPPHFEGNSELEEKVDEILDLKEKDPEADTKDLEEEIDQIVYQLYGLEDHEIEMIEEEFEGPTVV